MPADIVLHMSTISDNHIMYGSWIYGAQGTHVFAILDHFLPFYPTNNPETYIFEKMKKKNIWRYYHFKMCTINDNHMMYGS